MHSGGLKIKLSTEFILSMMGDEAKVRAKNIAHMQEFSDMVGKHVKISAR